MKILTNPLEISGELIHIIEDAKRFLFLISPFIQLEKKDTLNSFLIKKEIESAIQRNININFISKSQINNPKNNPKEILRPFIESGCNLYLLPNLHSKIYCNESKALITSMNIYLSSIISNYEIGVLLTEEIESKQFDMVKDYIKKLVYKCNLLAESEIKGFCIRCGNEILFDENRKYVLCDGCFSQLKEYKGDIWGSYCYLCGRRNKDITDLKPLCYHCYTTFNCKKLDW